MSASCSIRDLEAFLPGFWHGELWTPQRVHQIAEHFDYLRDYVRPVAKLGHDRAQDLAASAGFPCVGQVVAARINHRGALVLDIDNIPEPVGAAINAKMFVAVSIDVAPPIHDPKNPSRKLYPVLTGVAFLGEEQPEVKGLAPIPKATYADGREVPPPRRPEAWLTAVGALVSPEAFHGNPAIAFSSSAVTSKETAAMDPEKLKALTQALIACGIPPEKAGALARVLSGDTSMAAPPPGVPVDPRTQATTGAPDSFDQLPPMPTSPRGEAEQQLTAAERQQGLAFGAGGRKVQLTKLQRAILDSDVVRRHASGVRRRLLGIK